METRIIEAEKWLYITFCAFSSILFIPTSLLFFFLCLSDRRFAQPSAQLLCACPGICISELPMPCKGMVVSGYLSNETPAEAMLRAAGTFWLWALCQGCLLACTRDVQIFTDVIVLVSLPECFRSDY